MRTCSLLHHHRRVHQQGTTCASVHHEHRHTPTTHAHTHHTHTHHTHTHRTTPHHPSQPNGAHKTPKTHLHTRPKRPAHPHSPVQRLHVQTGVPVALKDDRGRQARQLRAQADAARSDQVQEGLLGRCYACCACLSCRIEALHRCVAGCCRCGGVGELVAAWAVLDASIVSNQLQHLRHSTAWHITLA